MRELAREGLAWVLEQLPFFLLPTLCLLLYFPALQHDFILDDRWLVTENPYIKSWGYLPQMLSQDAWNIWDHHNYWRPVFTLSLALDHSLWGLDATGFHLTNILLHAVNTALLYSLGKMLHNERSAALASLLFALHPIQAQPINIISMRGDLLAACFALLALHAFFARKTVFFAIALLCALLSKETSMVLPVALLFAWVLIQRDDQPTRIALAFVVLGIYLAIRFSLGFSFSLPPSVFSYDAPWDIRWLLAFKVLALYSLALLNLFEMPHPFWLVELPASLSDPYVIVGMLISMLLVAAIWVSFKKSPIAAFGLLWFVIYFLPISNLKELNQPMAEHWLYIPMVGLSLAFGTAMDSLRLFRFFGARILRLGITTSVIVFLFFATLVVREKAKVYENNESFLTAAIRANPHIARLYSLLGNVHFAKEDFSKAKGLYAQSLTRDPGDFVANYMLGQLLYQEGRQEDAKVHLQRITSINPSRRAEFSIVAHAWEMLGDKPKALFYYRKAYEIHPESDDIKGKIAALEESLRLDPSPSASSK